LKKVLGIDLQRMNKKLFTVLEYFGNLPYIFVYFSYEATASLAKPINKGFTTSSLLKLATVSYVLATAICVVLAMECIL
jgi:hypothetical protein